mmetsp:Transcript_6168/g.10736  ORF Transcript_6168/g.10736 Transcript_6168/m.10736 type:complete len:565 (-) Transcript_6168:76-1770(-)
MELIRLILILLSTLWHAAALRVEGEALRSADSGDQLADGNLSADAEDGVIWNYGVFGAPYCNFTERMEFYSYFKAFPGMGVNADMWTQPRPTSDEGDQAIIIYPLEDHNGAFAINDYMCFRMLSLARLYPSVTLVHLSSVPEAYDFLSAIKPGTVRHLVVGGHGSPSALAIGGCPSTLCQLRQYTPSARDFWLLARSRLSKEGGRIFLDSCLNGKPTPDGHNNAKYVAGLLPGVKIYSSQISLGVRNFVVTDYEKFDLMVRDLDWDTMSISNYVYVGNCHTAPADWSDTDGRTCGVYANKGLCLDFGNTTNSDGIQAKDACCQCGGGITGDMKELCPHFAEPVGSSDGKSLCKCLDEHVCYQDGHRGCELGDGHLFQASHGSQVECRAVSGLEACPVRGHANRFEGGECKCAWDEVCHLGSSEYPGCPGRYGRTRLDSFAADCEECHCVPKRDDDAQCKDGVCTCPPEHPCTHGSRTGCPVDANYAEKLAQGPINISNSSFAESCQFCHCGDHLGRAVEAALAKMKRIAMAVGASMLACWVICCAACCGACVCWSRSNRHQQST